MGSKTTASILEVLGEGLRAADPRPGAALGGAGGVFASGIRDGDGGGATSTGCDGLPDGAVPDGVAGVPGGFAPTESDGGMPLYVPGIIEKSGP